MFPAWEDCKILVDSTLSLKMLQQFAQASGSQVNILELEIRYRDADLIYLEDLIALHLPNLKEFTLKGKFPAAAKFPNPRRIIGKLGKVDIFNLFATNWHQLPRLHNGRVIFKSPMIGQMLAAMPNVTRINYFPDVDSPKDAHRHYNCFVYNLTRNEDLKLGALQEIQNFTFSLCDIEQIRTFSSKGLPLETLNILVEDEVSPKEVYRFLESFPSLHRLVIRGTTDSDLKWPHLPKLEELTLVGVNVLGTDFLFNFPCLKILHISQDRITPVDLDLDRGLTFPHALTCLKIVETSAVTGAKRLSNEGLSMIFRDLPHLLDLTIVQNFGSSEPSFSDEGITGSKMNDFLVAFSTHPSDLRRVNSSLKRTANFIGSLTELRRLTLKSSSITDVSIISGLINCQKLDYLDISSQHISEKACIAMIDHLSISQLRIKDFGGFTSSGKSDILDRMNPQKVFYS